MRHGHVHNPDKVLYGRMAEFRLSETGHQMARATAAHLKTSGNDIARVVASPLLRAQQTAQAIADAYGLPLDTDDRLIEAANVFEGEPVDGGPAYFLHPRNWWRLRNPFTPSWGEPYTEQRDRMFAAVKDAATTEPERETVLVSHQLPIWVTRLAVEGRRFVHDPRSRDCALASLTSLTIDDGDITGFTYAQPAAHVEIPS